MQQPASSSSASDVEAHLRDLLSSKTFSVVDYLNAALAVPPILDSIDDNSRTSDTDTSSSTTTTSASSTLLQQQQQQRLTELALSLQVQTTACHEDIGRISAELQAIVPRCATDLNRLSVGLSGLQQDVSNLIELSSLSSSSNSTNHNTNGEDAALSTTKNASQHEHAHTHNGTITDVVNGSSSSSCLETLSSLYNLQANLTRTKEILTAASTWDATLNSIPAMMMMHHQQPQQNTLDKAVQALAELERGSTALAGMPGKEERAAHVSKIRTQMYTLLSPQLLHAIALMNDSESSGSGHRLQPLQHLIGLYSTLGNLDALLHEYVKHRPVRVHKAWFDYGPGHGFVTWWPAWLDSVLKLLVEETRQASTLFGPVKAPDITVAVWKECFRPIQLSLASRLETLCSAKSKPPTHGGSDGNNRNDSRGGGGDLEGLCSVYESLLQFLSLAYNTIAGMYHDLVEANLIAQQQPSSQNNYNETSNNEQVKEVGRTSDAETLHGDIVYLFEWIASPFSVYQERLHDLELVYASTALNQLAKEMQATLAHCTENETVDSTTGGGFNDNDNDERKSAAFSPFSVEGLSTTSDALRHLSTRVLVLVDAAFARYDLLLGGYAIEEALQCWDQIVTTHLNHLTETIATITVLTTQSFQGSSTATSTTTTTATTLHHLDESLVTSSLQVLLIAGTVQQDVARWTKQMKQERLQVWSERMTQQAAAAATVRDNGDETTITISMHQARSSDPSRIQSALRSPSSSLFVLPDTYSPLEANAIVTRSVCARLFRQDPASVQTVLQGILTSSDNDQELFPQTQRAIQSLCHSCQQQVFNTCADVPLRLLSGLSSMACWKASTPIVGDASSLNDYGTLPQSYITQVGEHMLALVQALEPFASNPDALSLAQDVMKNVRHAVLPPWKDLIGATTGSSVAAADDDMDMDQVVRSLMDGKSLLELIHSPLVGPIVDDEEIRDVDGDSSRDITAFCNAWLDAVSSSVTGRLLERIMNIPSLSPKGCEHLHADLSYISNVLTALGVVGHPHPLLGHVAEIVTLDGDAISERMTRYNLSNPLEVVLSSMEERLTAIRGVAAKYKY